MSNPFTETWPPVRRWFLAGYIITTTMALACGSRAAIAADMPLKAAEAPAYRWSGCYAGINLGGGASGTNFTSTVDPGTHLLGADPALVAADGSGGANADGLLAGGQAGCNWQTGTFVAGLEGDFDYFHSNPNFSNNTNTLSDGVTPFTISQSLPHRGSAPGRARDALQRSGSFEPGHKKRGGRKKGSRNVISPEHKRALLEAALRVGSDGNGRGGIVGHFTWVRKRDLTFFYVDLWSRELELQIHEEAMSAAPPGTINEPGDQKKQPMAFELRGGPDDEVRDLMNLAIERPAVPSGHWAVPFACLCVISTAKGHGHLIATFAEDSPFGPNT